ncbi:MAG TPA: TniB family NTP-binding protein [Telluria sp.]|jgi:hypothetical protein
MNQQNIFSRVAQLDKIVVRHPALEKARLGIEDCVAKTQFFQEPVGCLLLGEGGMGKTTVCRSLLATMSESTKVELYTLRTLVPAFYASVPSPATVKSVAASLLAKLNDPSPLAGTTAHMTNRLCLLLAACETKLVLLDEIHHLFDIRKTSTLVNVQVCNWIKALVNATKVSLCLVGMPSFAPILSIDSQLARRFPVRFQLESLKTGTQDQPGNLVPFLNEVRHHAMQELGLTTFPRFDQTHNLHQIYAATGGSPAFVMSLIKESILEALKTGSSDVTVEDFAKAWDAGITAHANLSHGNPFRMSAGSLATALRAHHG